MVRTKVQTVRLDKENRLVEGLVSWAALQDLVYIIVPTRYNRQEKGSGQPFYISIDFCYSIIQLTSLLRFLFKLQ